jgi:CheY-like chemotaxis protein
MARTILLADDSPTIRKIVELTFSDTEIRVEAVATGQEAMDRLRELEPDLVLADVVMPAPTGYEICSSVKDSDNPVPVLLLAGSFEPFDQEQADRCGADGHLIKPFESQALRERVAGLLYPELGEEAAGSELEIELVMEEMSEEPALELEAPEPAVTEPQVADQPELSPEFVNAVAREVVGRLSKDVIESVAREVVPELAATIIRQRIRELEGEEQDGD